MTDQTYQQMPAEEIALLLTEALRAELARILLEQDTGAILDDDEIDARIALLEHENLTLKRRARRGDFSEVDHSLRKAADALGISLPATIPNDLGRRAVDLVREMKEIETKTLDGEDARAAAEPVVARFGSETVDGFLESRTVRLSDAWARALKRHPTKSMKGNIDAIARVAIEYFGDIPVSMITRLMQEEFVAWMGGEAHGPLLFPEIARRTETGKVTEAFGKALTRQLGHLELADFDEDLYAARKTLSSMLRSADVTDGQRQALAGHRAGSILNRHYTAHRTRDLKAAVDKADFKLEIVHSARHGHPIIKGCGLAQLESFSVNVVLGAGGEADVIEVSQSGAGESLFRFDRSLSKANAEDASAALRKAARSFRKLVGEHPLRLPKSTLKRAAIEHFHALG